MKSLVLAALIGTTLLPAQAQLLSPEAVGGAALGGLAGGIIGHNSGRKTAEGVAIGAGAGLLLGTLTHNARREQHYYATQVPVPAAPVYYSYPPARPNYAITGAALGGLAGGIIGHNSGRKTAEGIAIGAGAGLLLGSVAEQNARRQETVQYVAPAPVYVLPEAAAVPAAPATAPAAPSQPASIINNYYGSSSAMSGANSLFGR